MSLRTIKIIFSKEMKDTLRDRNILISQFLLPVLLYPLIVLITSFLFTGQIQRTEDSISRIYINNRWLTPGLSRVIEEEEQLEEVFSKNPGEDLKKGEVELILFIPPDFSELPSDMSSYELKFQYNSTNELSLIAKSRIDQVLRIYQEKLVANRLKFRGISEGILSPLQTTSTTVSTKKKEFGSMIGSILPFLIILFTLTGGFLPALDVIVGEKERGTLETLLVSKITKTDIILGKYLAIWATALMSTCLHFFSSSLTFLFLATQVLNNMPVSISGTMFLTVLFLMVPLSGFICALIMAVIMIARSYKEGSNYLSVMTFLMFLPLALVFSPSLKANYLTSLIPIFNISILFRDILRGDFHIGYTALTFVMTFIFSSIALWFSLKLFEQEDILFRESIDVSPPPFLTKKKFIRKGRFPSQAEIGVLLSITFLLIFFVGHYLQSKWFIPGIYMSQLLLILAPCILFLIFWKYDIIEILRIKSFSAFTFFITIILAFSGMIFTMQVSALQNLFTPFPNAEEILGPLLAILQEKKGILDFLIKFTMIAILPAICEETLFRGVIQSTLEKHHKKFAAIVITAVLFGIFHMNPYRFLPTMLIGLYLGYLAQKTGSIFPGMIVHAINNGLIYVLVYFFSENDPNVQWAMEESEFLPLKIFIPGLIVFILCIIALKKFYPPHKSSILKKGNNLDD